MTNREAYRDTLDTILAGVVAIVYGKPELCATANCKRCLFQDSCGRTEHKEEIIDWLNAEYQEPHVDWSKVPIDTPVLVSDTGETWIRRHFYKIDKYGSLLTYAFGRTSWSAECAVEPWAYMKLADGNE